MDLGAILRAIDAEIEKLTQVREIITSLGSSRVPGRKSKGAKRAQELLPFDVAPAAAEPQVVVVSPVKKREYRRRPRAVVATGALTAAPSARPVFVPRARVAVAAKTVAQVPVVTPDQMEAAMRKRLLGGTA